MAIVAGGRGEIRGVGNSSEIWDFTKGDTADWEWRKFFEAVPANMLELRFQIFNDFLKFFAILCFILLI